MHLVYLKPGFYYPSWRPELTARVDGWPVSITRQHGPCWRARVSTSRVDVVLMARQLEPSTRVVETGLNCLNHALWTPLLRYTGRKTDRIKTDYNTDKNKSTSIIFIVMNG